MCGIFGAIGTKMNDGIIRALALANRERGTDSIGFFDNTGKSVKAADDPIECIGNAEISDFIGRACSKGWFIAGHTRFATRGATTRKNAHPFRFGNIIGAHNGMVDAPDKYAVDSMYLFDLLRQHAGDYQAALADVGGYWALTWFDGANFYMQAHRNSFALCKMGGAWYYSSDSDHLAACTGKRKCIAVNGGTTLRFSINRSDYETLAPFVSTVTAKPAKTSYTGTRKRSKDAFGLPARYQTHDLISSTDYDDADDLCRRFGYRSFEDFMDQEGLHSESQAYSLLYDSIEYDRARDNSWNADDSWIRDADRTDEVPF